MGTIQDLVFPKMSSTKRFALQSPPPPPAPPTPYHRPTSNVLKRTANQDLLRGIERRRQSQKQQQKQQQLMDQQQQHVDHFHHHGPVTRSFPYQEQYYIQDPYNRRASSSTTTTSYHNYYYEPPNYFDSNYDMWRPTIRQPRYSLPFPALDSFYDKYIRSNYPQQPKEKKKKKDSLGLRIMRFAVNMKSAMSFLTIVTISLIFGICSFYIFTKGKKEDLVCPTHSFKCPSENNCVSFRYLCDGINQCFEGTDELSTHCSDLSNLEKIFGNMVKMNVTFNRDGPQVTIVDDGDSCGVLHPRGCKCRNDYVFCHNTNWPKGFDWRALAANTSRLALRKVFGKKMKVWEAQPLYHMYNLQVLAVEYHSHIPNFTWEFIQRRDTLGKLYLNSNGIVSLKSDDFIGFTKIMWLFVAYNKLTELYTHTYGHLQTLTLLDLSYNKITSSSEAFPPMRKLKEVYLQGNKFRFVHQFMFSELKRLEFLSLAENGLESIHSKTFQYNLFLKELDLTFNKLHRLPGDLFDENLFLNRLGLAGNQFKTNDSLPMTLFVDKRAFRSLDVHKLDVESLDIRIFQLMFRLEFAHFDKFEYCHFIPYIPKCKPSTDGLSTMRNLLGALDLRSGVWIIGLMALAGNCVVLSERCFKPRRRIRMILDIFINQLAVADALMGLYFITIGLKDFQFRDAYNAYAYMWSHSYLCTFSGVLAFISREVSLMFITVMAFERFFVIYGPFTYDRLTKKLTLSVVGSIWVIGFILSIVPLFTPKVKHSFYGSSGLCFSLHLNDPHAIGWEYSTFVFVCLNSICVILTTFFYGLLFWTVKAAKVSTPSEVNETKMATRLFIMVLIDLMSWLPIIFMKLATLQGYEIKRELHAWIIIIILPFNAAVNPWIYTLSSTRRGVKCLQWFISCTHLGKYHTYQYDSSDFDSGTITSNSLTSDDDDDDDDSLNWSYTDWEYEDRQAAFLHPDNRDSIMYPN